MLEQQLQRGHVAPLPGRRQRGRQLLLLHVHLHVQHHQGHHPHAAAAGCCYQEVCAGPHPLQRSLGRMLLLVVVVWGRLVLWHWLLLLLLLWQGGVQMQLLLQMVVCQGCRAT